ncbi:MAG: exodeoxyribonuclease VII small subunit [Abditibacteriales bacterium]|nr:exodeoxyribonuclease VII small subunit [Abditibacteriales bacterium]MDW8366774.1 exodeoxyribonuclease VII small subunit [Abditibacteriales bacterium]
MDQPTNNDLSFEEALQQLEAIVEKLESGEASLEESLALFERGMGLAKLCEDKLNRAATKIQELTVSADGTLTVREASWLEESDDGTA